MYTPFQFALDSMWFWSVIANAMLRDLTALSGKKPSVALIVISGGKHD